MLGSLFEPKQTWGSNDKIATTGGQPLAGCYYFTM